MDPIFNVSCGVRHKPPSKETSPLEQVWVGNKAKKHSIPWQVGLKRLAIKENGKKQFELVCGGTLVSSRHVVTAAHCTYCKKIIMLMQI